MFGVDNKTETKYYPYDGYESVVEVITHSCVGGPPLDFFHYIDRSTFFYRNTQYQTLEAAFEARRRDIAEDQRESHGHICITTKHTMQNQESIYQYSHFKLTFIKGQERRRELESEYFEFHGKRYSDLHTAQQARDVYVKNKTLHDRANAYAWESLFSEGQKSVDAAKKALDVLKTLIESNPPAIGNRHKEQRAAVNRHYQAELLILDSKKIESKLDKKTTKEKIVDLQKIKELYASAMQLKTAKLEMYREARAKISALKAELESKPEKQDKVVIQQISQEQQLYQEAIRLTEIANLHPSDKNYQVALDKYSEVIALETKNIDNYKFERAKVFQQSKSFLSNEKDKVLETIKQMQKNINTMPLAQRIIALEQLIEFCENSNQLPLQKIIQDAKSTLASEQEMLNKLNQVTKMHNDITELHGESLSNHLQNIMDILEEMIIQSPKEMSDYKAFRADINRLKMRVEQENKPRRRVELDDIEIQDVEPIEQRNHAAQPARHDHDEHNRVHQHQ
jgi:hypothetical protein